MLEEYFKTLPTETIFPCILLVGCGTVGENLVKTLIDQTPHGLIQIYITDSDKDKARKLSEYRLSSITPIRWRSSHDTPEDVDVIVIAVDYDSEHKVIERLALSKKPFVSLSDNASVFESYEEYETEFNEGHVSGIVGSGLVPGVSNVLVKHVAGAFDQVFDIVVERLGFVSGSSLDSVKVAMKDSPLCVRDGILSESRRLAGTSLSWFPQPYDLVECQSVASGVSALSKSFPEVHNLSVRFAEPKLPTFSERLRHIFLKEPLTTSRACIRVELHGIIDGHIETRVVAIAGNAMTIILHTCIMAIFGLVNSSTKFSQTSPFINCDQVIDSKTLLSGLHESGVKIFKFEGNEN